MNKKAINWIASVGIIGTIIQWAIKLWKSWTGGSIETDDIDSDSNNESQANNSENQVEIEHNNIENETNVTDMDDGGISANGNTESGNESIPDPTPIKPTTNDSNVISALPDIDEDEGISF